MDIREYDILTMKKAHPCGGMRWQVLRTGADFRQFRKEHPKDRPRARGQAHPESPVNIPHNPHLAKPPAKLPGKPPP